MPKYRITDPSGKTYEITAPDGATREDALAYAQKQFSAAPAKSAQEQFDPTEGMSTTERLIAGYGSAIPRMARGVGQRLGLVSQADVDEANRLDAPLLRTGAGSVGNIAGSVMAAVPTMAIPGAASIPGAAAIGAAQGLATPTSSAESPVQNAVIGGVAGPAAIMAGRAVLGGVQGARALVEPFTAAGRDRIAGRTLQRFASDPASLRNMQGAMGPSLTGTIPTLAEQTGDAGIARLQDALRSVDPQIANRIDSALATNNATRVNRLRDLAGADGRRDFTAANRDATGNELYGRARAQGIDPASLSPSAQANIASFQARVPEEIIDRARQLAKINGVNLDNESSIQGMHWIKTAIDGRINTAKQAGDKELASAYTGLQQDLLSGLDEISPAYGEARRTFAAMSRPVNQMDTSAEILRRSASPMNDLPMRFGEEAYPRLMPGSMAKAMADEGGITNKAIGRRTTLESLLDPTDLRTVRQIASEVDRGGAVARAANGPGSATAQRMASQNILRQLIGPTGLPSSWAESAIANTVVGKPLNLIYGGVAEPRIQNALADALLDPDVAAAAIRAARTGGGSNLQNNRLLDLVRQGARVTPSALAIPNDR